MLSLKLQSEIDKKWEACWPVSQIKPLIFFDLLSYLLFIKKIEELQLTERRSGKSAAGNFSDFEEQEFRWSSFKEMDAQNMHKLFTKENGILDVIKNYGDSNYKYSLFVKEPLLLIPTAVLLANTVDIIKILDGEEVNIQGEIFEYLLDKVEIVGQNGHVHPPGYVVDLIFSLLEPKAKEIIIDPVAGYADFLVKFVNFLARSTGTANKHLKREVVPAHYIGFDADPVQLRIGAMNVILHGIEDPPLAQVTVFNKSITDLPQQPAIILANLIFKQNENAFAGGGASKNELANEIELLSVILNNLKKGGRAAVIIPAILLYDNSGEITKLRQRITNEHTLEAVITLPFVAGSIFSGSGILIFSKPVSGITDKTWFYKITSANNLPGEGSNKSNAFADKEKQDEIQTSVHLWKNKDQNIAAEREDKTFYVMAEEIANNNYNLSFNQYKKIGKEDQLYREDSAGKIQKQQIPVNYKNELIEPGLITTGSAQEIPGFKKRLTVILAAAFVMAAMITFYFLYLNNQDSSLSAIKAGKIIKTLPQDSTYTITPQNQAVRDSGLQSKPGNMLSAGDSAKSASGEKYTVIAKAYFHQMPDESTRGRAYIDHWNNVILYPIEDKNGFIYIIYTNQFGRTSKGWLNKKDLKAL